MRTSTLALALPALASAQQFPFLDQLNPYIDQAKSYLGVATSSVSSAASAASATIPTSIPDPVAAGAATFAATKVDRLTLENHSTLLKSSSPGIEEWMFLVTGGNASCFGMCQRAEAAWNESVALISASSSPPKLAMLDCDNDGVLCAAWALSPPTIIHAFLPHPLPDQSTPETTMRAINLNRTTVTAPEIAAIHLQETYKDVAPYEGFWHPFNGMLAQYGLQVPAGYAIYYFAKIPSWAFMIGVSFISRSVMSRRMGAAPTRPAGGAPAT
ncbi:hypothetical protein LTS10_004426 [Elasticomyces elasticus]|nr:hypothetical protein LTS10_004426 [Elasticomyces elasticus]